MLDASFLVSLALSLGYLGIFLASLIGSASIFLPLPSFLIVTAAGTSLNPILVGISAGLGSAIGELVGYAVGLGLIYGKKKISKKKKQNKPNKYSNLVKKWFRQKKGAAIIFIFALTPLPDDIVGLVCGAIKYDVKKFFLATLAGKIILHVALAYAGFYGIEFIRSLFLA